MNLQWLVFHARLLLLERQGVVGPRSSADITKSCACKQVIPLIFLCWIKCCLCLQRKAGCIPHMYHLLYLNFFIPTQPFRAWVKTLICERIAFYQRYTEYSPVNSCMSLWAIEVTLVRNVNKLLVTCFCIYNITLTVRLCNILTHFRVKKGCFSPIISPSKNVVRLGYSCRKRKSKLQPNKPI